CGCCCVHCCGRCGDHYVHRHVQCRIQHRAQCCVRCVHHGHGRYGRGHCDHGCCGCGHDHYGCVRHRHCRCASVRYGQGACLWFQPAFLQWQVCCQRVSCLLWSDGQTTQPWPVQRQSPPPVLQPPSDAVLI